MTKLVVVSIGFTIGVAGIALLSLSNSVPKGIPAGSYGEGAVGEAVIPADNADKDKARIEDSSLGQPRAPSQPDYPVGSPEAVVAAYARANTWQERLPFIKHTDSLEDKMADHYGNRSLAVNFARIAARNQMEIPVGDVLPVDLVIDAKNIYRQPVSQTITYYLERTPAGYAVLWEPSVGWQPIGWTAFQASRSTVITELQLRCRLTNNYFSVDPSENVKQTHYELEIKPDNAEFYQPTVAYVAKNSPAGVRIFETLSDGKEHPLVLGLQFRERQGEECVWLRYLASDRAYVYDAHMRRELIAPIEVAVPTSIGWAAFKASRPTGITELQLRCKLTHNYFGTATQASVKHTHYELKVRPDDSGYDPPLIAYVAKESPAGERIFQVLSDGQEHPMVLGVQFRDQANEECLWIRELISDRREAYDAEMRHQYVSPIEVALPASRQEEEAPFGTSDISARWVVNRDVLGSQILIVPEARFRVTALSATPIVSLRVKLVYLLSRQAGDVEVLYEDSKTIVSSSDRPLGQGFSKSVISRSGKGYKYKPENVAALAALVSGANAEVELYYDTGNGFTKLQTIPVVKSVTD